MADEKPTASSVLEIHEEFLQHVEAGSAKIRTLSAVTIFVSALLAASYLVEIASPYLFGLTTASVNLIGSLTIGLLAGLIATERLHLSAEWRTFVFVGLLGGFTTFSTFSLDGYYLIERGQTLASFA